MMSWREVSGGDRARGDSPLKVGVYPPLLAAGRLAEGGDGPFSDPATEINAVKCHIPPHESLFTANTKQPKIV